MRRPWIVFATIFAVFVGLWAVAVFTDLGPDRDWDDRQTVQTIERSDGTVDTVVIERDGPPPFFFPFGLIFFGLLVFGLIRLVTFGRWRGGPGGPGGCGSDERARERFHQWHREEHERMDGAPTPSNP